VKKPSRDPAPPSDSDYRAVHSAKGALMVDLLDEVLRLHGRLQAAMRHNAEGTGLSASMSILLATIVCSTQPPTVPRIARALGQSRQAVQRTADQLANEGYVGWEANPEHRRAHLLIPTARGRAMFDQANTASAVWADSIVAELDAGALTSTLATLKAIRHGLERKARAAVDKAR
jgi:DNA-binding MarR family transcriptional regulator